MERKTGYYVFQEDVNLATVIYGNDLITADTGLSPTLRDQIDPEGFSVVSLALPDDAQEEKYKLFVWLKLKDNPLPQEGVVVLTARDMGKIVRSLDLRQFEGVDS